MFSKIVGFNSLLEKKSTLDQQTARITLPPLPLHRWLTNEREGGHVYKYWRDSIQVQEHPGERVAFYFIGFNTGF